MSWLECTAAYTDRSQPMSCEFTAFRSRRSARAAYGRLQEQTQVAFSLSIVLLHRRSEDHMQRSVVGHDRPTAGRPMLRPNFY